jgi:hypothetical protein
MTLSFDPYALALDAGGCKASGLGSTGEEAA